MRAALLLVLFATSAVLAAPKKPEEPLEPPKTAAPPKAKRAPTAQEVADGKQATALLEKIVTATDASSRKAAIAELTKLAPTTIPALDAWLSRAHAASVEDRRGVLAEIHAAVPDKSGKFATPPRQTGKERQADDELDWLVALLELPASPAAGEVIADVAAIRALASTNDIEAALWLFGVAFGDDTMIYRDEVGRYIRKMEPYSIPALTRESQGKADRRRYATYQLERIDRQDPLKAIAASLGNEALLIAVLDTFRETRLREAVHAVWTKVDDDSPRVRAAARAAWMAYVAGPPPPPAPRKKLQLPGGKLTKKEKPLWLTYRELADNELRKASNELLQTEYPLDDEEGIDDNESNYKPVKLDLPKITKQLFDHFDGERAKKEAAQWTTAKAQADGGDLQGATAVLDRLIGANPERAERAEMAKVYARWAKQLEDKQQWAEAAAAYSKAHGLDPKGATATDTLAAFHFAQGKALEASGKDGGPDFRRAVALKPDHAPAEAAAERAATAGRPSWMLYAAGGALAFAMLLFAVAMVRRRAA